MQYSIIFLSFFSLSCLCSFGQAKISLEDMVLTADTILLVLHEQTDGVIIENEITGEQRLPDKVVHNQRPNYSIITNSKVLSKSYASKLLEILNASNRDSKIETCVGFFPFHAILFLKDGSASFIDISFGCNSYVIYKGETRSDLYYMDKKKRSDLESLFKMHGISVD